MSLPALAEALGFGGWQQQGAGFGAGSEARGRQGRRQGRLALGMGTAVNDELRLQRLVGVC